MRTSQSTCSCPSCHERAVLTLTEFLTGERAGEHEFSFRCPAGCEFSQDECLQLWVDSRSKSA